MRIKFKTNYLKSNVLTISFTQFGYMHFQWISPQTPRHWDPQYLFPLGLPHRPRLRECLYPLVLLGGTITTATTSPLLFYSPQQCSSSPCNKSSSPLYKLPSLPSSRISSPSRRHRSDMPTTTCRYSFTYRHCSPSPSPPWQFIHLLVVMVLLSPSPSHHYQNQSPPTCPYLKWSSHIISC